MDHFICPFCGDSVASTYEVSRSITIDFFDSFTTVHHKDPAVNAYDFTIEFHRCPSCGRISIIATGIGDEVKERVIYLNPISNARVFPSYIPEPIRNDYEEACSIVTLSPKASATLSRRCLQGMIHDYWNVHQKNLNAEISSLKDKVEPSLWDAIDAVRSLGNIGAHMESDINTVVSIDPNEASQLLKLIELLMKEWYIQRHDREELIKGLKLTANSKKTSK